MPLTISQSQENVEKRRPNHRLSISQTDIVPLLIVEWEAACLLESDVAPDHGWLVRVAETTAHQGFDLSEARSGLMRGAAKRSD